MLVALCIATLAHMQEHHTQYEILLYTPLILKSLLVFNFLVIFNHSSYSFFKYYIFYFDLFYH
jgi:hypothetical protein